MFPCSLESFLFVHRLTQSPPVSLDNIMYLCQRPGKVVQASLCPCTGSQAWGKVADLRSFPSSHWGAAHFFGRFSLSFLIPVPILSLFCRHSKLVADSMNILLWGTASALVNLPDPRVQSLSPPRGALGYISLGLENILHIFWRFIFAPFSNLFPFFHSSGLIEIKPPPRHLIFYKEI